jgi:hypothetical protein
VPALRAPIPSEQESVGALVSRLSGDVTRIVRAEVRLLQLRASALADALKAAGGLIAVGVVLALAGLGALVAGLVLVVAIWLPAWAAALVVGGGVLVLAVVMLLVQVRVLSRGVAEALVPTGEVAAEEGGRGE